MFFRRTSQAVANSLDDEPVAVLVQPKPGYSEDDVVAAFRAAGVLVVTILAPGFISAKAHREVLSKIGKIAHVELKAKKQPRDV